MSAQQDSTALPMVKQMTANDTIPGYVQEYTFEEVAIEAFIVKDPLTTKNEWTIDEIRNTGINDVSDVLQQSAGVNIRGYGAGGLATVSFRGTGAGRSATVWNGMPLIGSTLGLLDYSLLNANLFESVGYTLGGNASQGSGAIGGSVYLDNRSRLRHGEYSIGIKSLLGSFDRFHQGLNYATRKGKWWTATRLSWEHVDQDFTYRLREDLPEIINTNAQRDQFALLHSVGLHLDEKNRFEFHLWAQDNQRQIPPTTVQNRSEAVVRDKTLRLQGIWNHHTRSRWYIKTIAAVSHNQNIFEDPLSVVFGDNVFNQLYVKSEASYATEKGNWLLGASNRLTRAQTENYVGEAQQNQSSLFVSYSTEIRYWHIFAALRQDLIDNNFIPFTGQVLVRRTFLDKLDLGFQINKHFRAPGLNDLFWAPGGNPDLQSELGWSQEVSIAYRLDGNYKIGVTAYNNKVENWIQWGLLDGRNFFSALNLPEVWSRGFEVYTNGFWGNEDKHLKFQLSYNYNPSTFEFSFSNPVIIENEQVFYSPMHQAVATISWVRPSYSIWYTHRLQSGINTILDPLDGFHIGQLRAQYRYKEVNFFFEVNNLWDAEYRVVERRAMPGRHFAIGLNFKLINKFKK